MSRLSRMVRLLPALALASVTMATSAEAQRGDGPTDFTTTNVQEEGVDEPDLVKTDGQTLYVVQNATLHVVDAWPPERAKRIAALSLGGPGESLFLTGRRAVSLAGTGVPFSGVRVTIIDVSDPSAPVPERVFDLDGALVGARMVDDLVYVASVRRFGFVALLRVVCVDPASARRATSATHVVLAPPGTRWHVYGTQNSMYVANDSRWWGWPGGVTRLHRFALNRGAPAHAASGVVAGRVRDSYSLSQFEGHLRVATTDRQGNHVFALRAAGSRLQQVGKLRGVLPGERISRVRFVDGLGYVATRAPFGRRGSLAVADLSEPSAPRVSGELHITGFSTYLHPVGSDHLVGVGRAARADGQVPDFHVQLFNVSDPASPRLPHRLQRETWLGSEALRNPHAFTFSERLGVGVVPVDQAGAGSTAVLFELGVTPSQELRELGEVDHGDARVRRSVIMDDYVFVLSAAGVTASHIDDPGNPVARVPFERRPER